MEESNRVPETEKVSIITGANSGIGFYTARNLLRKGYRVILACRDQEKCLQAAEKLTNEKDPEIPSNAKAECMSLDLSSLKSVRHFVAEFKKRKLPLHVLICNAGIYCPPFSLTQDGFESQFQVNYLSHFLLTQLLLDKLKASAPARIINVSSRAHARGTTLDFDDLQSKKNYNRFTAYGRSKLMQILSTYALQRKLDGTGVTVNALHPGVVNTGLWHHLPLPLQWVANGMGPLFFKTPEQGAETSTWAATSEDLEGVGGKYFVDCAAVESSAYSYDEQAARQLWEESVRLLHEAGGENAEEEEDEEGEGEGEEEQEQKEDQQHKENVVI
jgi:NAD(P)-dependent dehydrogenase (short-subunit alcohol dehydrogenase family)